MPTLSRDGVKESGSSAALLSFQIFRALGALVLFVLIALSAVPPKGATPKGANAAPLRFGEMYGGVSSLGLVLSDKLKSLEGRSVVMEGFMAPPLKPSLGFFVLTRVPMSICPFCSSDAEWPYDIVAVYLREPVTALPFDRPIRVEGRLEIGTKTDGETGFVSLVRVYATRLREAEA
jgi:hypothetical protein